MKRWLKQESGLSLMELLATIVIASILITFIISLFVFIQSKSTSQKEEVSGLNDITLALKSITKDIRYADDVETGDNYLKIFFPESEEPKQDVIYELRDSILMKDNTKYIYNVKTFNTSREEKTITIEIKSKSGKGRNTEIVLRGGE